MSAGTRLHLFVHTLHVRHTLHNVMRNRLSVAHRVHPVLGVMADAARVSLPFASDNSL